MLLLCNYFSLNIAEKINIRGLRL